MFRCLAVALLAAALVAGCSSGGGDAHPSTTSAEPTVQPGPARLATGTATTDVREDDLLLRPDGLGTVAFGASPEAVLTKLTAFLGPPDEDSGWGSPFGRFGTCPGNGVRGVRWGRLRVLFADGTTPWGPSGSRHFFTWSYGVPVAQGATTPALHTASGVTVGTTVADLRRIYGNRASIDTEDKVPFGPSFSLRALPQPQAFGGYLTDEPGPGQAVDALYGGAACGE